jgi:hypothetical protein
MSEFSGTRRFAKPDSKKKTALLRSNEYAFGDESFRKNTIKRSD